MTVIMKLLERTASIRGLSLFFGLYLIVFGVIQVTLTKLNSITNGIGILDFEVGYTKQRVLEVFGSYGGEGMALYQNIQLLDILNPVLYSWLFAMILFLLFRGTRMVWTVILPLLIGLFDYAENAMLFEMARSYPDISDLTITISSNLSLLKFSAIIASLAAFSVGVLFRIWYLNMMRKERIQNH